MSGVGLWIGELNREETRRKGLRYVGLGLEWNNILSIGSVETEVP
jgi:hypothetical protein